VACPSAPAPPGTALSDFARRNPSEIPSRTQSVSAFLPSKVSMGCATRGITSVTFAHAVELVRRPGLLPVPPANSAQGMPPRLRVSPQIKNRKAPGRYKPAALTRMIHGGFYYIRRYAAATRRPLVAHGQLGGLAAQSVNVLFEYASLLRVSARPSRQASQRFRYEPP